MPTAKSYDNFKIQGEPFADENNRLWVRITGSCLRCSGTGHYSYNPIYGSTCFACNGTGHMNKQVRWYTEAERAKMDERDAADAAARQANANYKRGPIYNHFGSPDGFITLILGDTYSIKDQLKAAGCLYSSTFGWYVPNEVPLPQQPNPTYQLSWRDASDTDNFIKSPEELRAFITTATTTPSESTYQGEIGEKLSLTATVVRNVPLESHYGLSHCHVFEDENHNIYSWITAAKDIAEGSRVQICGTVKAHKEYRGVPQTVLTRCKIKYEEETANVNP